MSPRDVERYPIGGIDWWEMQRERFEGFETFNRLIPEAYRLVAEGRPVPLHRLAAAVSLPEEDVEAALRRQPGTDWDERGRLAGFGLTLRPTPHRFTFDGRTVFAWCASDVLMFPVVLGRSGTVESPCPATGRLIRGQVTPERVEWVDPSGAVVSLVRPDRLKDIRGEVCALGSFFASEDAATEWLAANPNGMVHSVEHDFQLHQEIMARLGWARAGRSAA